MEDDELPIVISLLFFDAEQIVFDLLFVLLELIVFILFLLILYLRLLAKDQVEQVDHEHADLVIHVLEDYLPLLFDFFVLLLDLLLQDHLVPKSL